MPLHVPGLPVSVLFVVIETHTAPEALQGRFHLGTTHTSDILVITGIDEAIRGLDVELRHGLDPKVLLEWAEKV